MLSYYTHPVLDVAEYFAMTANGDNNGQAMHGARKHAWRTQAAWAKMNPSYLIIVLLLSDLSYLEIADD